MAPPPALMDDLIGEILLRLPPDDPACLFRAALVCKPWRRLLSDDAFLRRYRAFHRTPPVLGFFHDGHHIFRFVPRFFPVCGASPIPHPDPDCWTVDCRHGRVLLHSLATSHLMVWDPIAGDHEEIPLPVNEDDEESELFTAAVICASGGCSHLDCRRGPYLIVFAGADSDDEGGVAWARVYSSVSDDWSSLVSVHLGPVLDAGDVMGKSLLAGDALYFTIEEGRRILKYEYDMVEQELSVIKAPPVIAGNMALVTAEGGGLGAAGVKGYSLHLWSWRIGPDSIGEWVPDRVIELDKMISIGIGDPTTKLNVIGFAEGAGSIFINANDSIFIVEVKSGTVRKTIGKRGDFSIIFPFVSLYTPDHGSTTLRVSMSME
ncbi:unnamed protein product [Urochloa decumbens]|uniref:F-box domain-containing protein n=1 Tax=Urochloa decumbens TaxID=240449 RepID=A0ABC9FLG4_9POAL